MRRITQACQSGRNAANMILVKKTLSMLRLRFGEVPDTAVDMLWI